MEMDLGTTTDADVSVKGLDTAKRTGPVVSHALSPAMTRRGFAAMLATAVVPSWANPAAAGSWSDLLVSKAPPEEHYPLFEEATANVLPPAGHVSKIALNDSIVRLVRHGVIDQHKFLALHQAATFRDELTAMLSEPSEEPIYLTEENAADYVNLLWPIGLSNHMEGNATSPLFTVRLRNFASTAGWTLGDQDQGSAYFNRFKIVELTQAQETTAIAVAKSTFRPCCDNSTFFQDCNHGSALLGVLQLGASQGLGEAELYREALAFNSFWFRDYYIRTALYFKVVRKQEWRDVDPKGIMSEQYSAISSWQQTVQATLATMPDLIPRPRERANCGVGGSVLYRR